MDGISPDNLFLDNDRTTKFLNFPIVEGMVPESMFCSMLSKVRFTRLPIAAGIVSEIRLPLKFSSSRFVERLPTDFGRLPFREFPSSAKVNNRLQFVREVRNVQFSACSMLLPRISRLKLLKDPRDGIEPLSELLERSITWSFDMLASEAGTIPFNSLLLKINDSRFGSEWPVLRSICPPSLLKLNPRYLSDEILYIMAGTFPDNRL